MENNPERRARRPEAWVFQCRGNPDNNFNCPNLVVFNPKTSEYHTLVNPPQDIKGLLEELGFAPNQRRSPNVGVNPQCSNCSRF